MTPPAINDAHCHFFSPRFFEGLAAQAGEEGGPEAGGHITARLGWDAPGTADALADRWAAELDRHHVGRAALIASLPGDEASVAAAVGRHPTRFVGMFMFDPAAPDAEPRLRRALAMPGLCVPCLFPAMHRYALHDAAARRVFAVASESPGAAVFVHCGVLSIGVRRKLGLPSRFDMRLGNPLDLHVIANEHPRLPIIVPHFGAGFFREALMLADLCPNVHLDTSSSNAWLRYQSGLTLTDVFRQALEVVGPDRLLFGTDSSFFPRGWQAPIYEAQQAALAALGADTEAVRKIFAGNFDRLFPVPAAGGTGARPARGDAGLSGRRG